MDIFHFIARAYSEFISVYLLMNILYLLFYQGVISCRMIKGLIKFNNMDVNLWIINQGFDFFSACRMMKKEDGLCQF